MRDLTVTTAATMSSREIAGLTGKRHDHVKRDIESMLAGLKIDAPSFGGIYLDSMNREQTEYQLPKRETLILVSGYSVELRAKIIDRWQELEAQQAPAIPQTFADALRLAADQQEQIAKLALENHQQAQKIDVLENLLAQGISAPNFCRHLNGVNTQAINAFLKGKGWLFEGGGYAAWKVTSKARDQYMTERAFECVGSKGAFVVNQPVLLRKGALWPVYQYMQGSLPMKKSWNGTYQHDLGAEGAV